MEYKKMFVNFLLLLFSKNGKQFFREYLLPRGFLSEEEHEKIYKLFNNYAPYGKRSQFNRNDIRHENIRSNMLIAIIRYANNNCRFIIFDLSFAVISSPLNF
jgi:hypothetical protein